jgi:hypothetical protein
MEQLKLYDTPISNFWTLPPLFKEALQQKFTIFYNGKLISKINDDERVLESDDPLKTARKLFITKIKKGFKTENQDVPLGAMKPGNYKDSGNVNWPVFIMPRITGATMLTKIISGEVVGKSSSGNNISCSEHILNEITEFMYYLPSGSF